MRYYLGAGAELGENLVGGTGGGKAKIYKSKTLQVPVRTVQVKLRTTQTSSQLSNPRGGHCCGCENIINVRLWGLYCQNSITQGSKPNPSEQFMPLKTKVQFHRTYAQDVFDQIFKQRRYSPCVLDIFW